MSGEDEPGGFEERLERYDDEGAALRALLALDAGGMASWRWDLRTDMVTGDDRLAQLYGFAPGHWPIPVAALSAFVHPRDEARLKAAMQASIEEGGEYEAEFRVRRTAGADPDDRAGWRWLGGRGRAVAAVPGEEPITMLGINWDITDRKLGEERLVMMALEMDHRVKNAFAVMRALVNIGRRRATDLQSFAEDLNAQVQAMADGHEVAARLAREGTNPRPAIPIAEVFSIVLAPWRESQPDRLTLSMNPRLAISSAKVSGLTMLLHELSTNAVKHGALRPSGGHLRVTVEETRRDGKAAARLVWNEQSAMPLSPKAEMGSSGFGSVLIEHCMSVLGATYARELRAEGLKMTVVLPTEPTDPRDG